MADSRKTHYLNAEFDLSLRPRPKRLERPALARQVAELSVQGLLGAESGDAAVLRVGLPDGFLEHLEACGAAAPRVLTLPEIEPGSELRPFGWTAEAVELNRRHDRPAKHPPLETVRRVNARSFARELEADLALAVPPGSVVERREELEAFLSEHAGREWVVKAEHSNSGLGNRRLKSAALSEADRDFVDELLQEDDRLIVEPWLDRDRDWCVVFDVPFDERTLRIHETICTRDGALIGALFEEQGPIHTPERVMAEAAAGIASRLQHEGYFGPACFDAFRWQEEEREELRLLADLNCRRSMSDGAYRLWRRIGAERSFYYRFFNRRKLTLPSELKPALEALGTERYDPARRQGVLLVSPPGFSKLAVIFAADDREAIFAMERQFRRRFEA